jgi:hypothetical protein
MFSIFYDGENLHFSVIYSVAFFRFINFLFSYHRYDQHKHRSKTEARPNNKIHDEAQLVYME